MFVFATADNSKFSFQDLLESISKNTGVGKTIVSETMKSRAEGKVFNYASLFSNEMIEYTFSTLRSRAMKAKDKKEQEDTEAEIRTLVLVYCVVVYHLYPKFDWLSKTINSEKMLTKNFNSVKKWLDVMNGKNLADSFVESIRHESDGEFFN